MPKPSDFADLLKKDKAIISLNFEIFGFRFSPGQYKNIADRITNKEINIVFQPDVLFRKGVEAGWNVDRNLFMFKTSTDFTMDYYKALSAHEATHCIHDMMAPGCIETAIAEGVGYLAEALALRAIDGDIIKPDPKATGDAANNTIREAAQILVNRIWNENGEKMVVPDGEAALFKQIIARHPDIDKNKPKFMNLTGLET